ncbi:MAG: hypothetical protein ABIT09_02635 [Croceibacterium sp.]
MSTRIFNTLALMLVAGCGRQTADAYPVAAQAAGDAIDCALAGSAGFSHDCTVERVKADSGLQLVVRHPDGGFRRFEVLTDGRGLATADGAQAAKVTVRDGGIEVSVGTDRYRFPATIVNHDSR